MVIKQLRLADVFFHGVSLNEFLADERAVTKIAVQVGFAGLMILLGLFYQHSIAPLKAQGKAAALDIHKRQRVRSDRPRGQYEERVAIVDELLVYPIKSCAAVSLGANGSINLLKQGIALDRRWMVIRAKDKKKLTLNNEALLTLIQPTIDIDSSPPLLRLAMRPNAAFYSKEAAALPPISVPLHPDQATFEQWDNVERIEMYGDAAGARVVERPDNDGEYDGSASDWISTLLGYPVLLVQFDPFGRRKRAAFPIFKPPNGLDTWDPEARSDLLEQRGIEFQDEYPLLCATRESLEAVREQIQSGVAGDSEFASFSPSLWKPSTESDTQQDHTTFPPPHFQMERFRPNIVLRSLLPARPLAPFAEDSMETIMFVPPTSSPLSSTSEASAAIHLVARCERCPLTLVDPDTAQRDRAVPLQLLRKSHLRNKKGTRLGPCFGMYGCPEQIHGGAGAAATRGRRSGEPFITATAEPQLEEWERGDAAQAYGRVSVGDHVVVRWRPFDEDDEDSRQRPTTLLTKNKQD